MFAKLKAKTKDNTTRTARPHEITQLPSSGKAMDRNAQDTVDMGNIDQNELEQQKARVAKRLSQKRPTAKSTKTAQHFRRMRISLG